MSDPADPSAEIERLRAQLEGEQSKLRALQDIGQALGSTLDLEELIELLLGRITRIMEAEQATLFVVDEDTGELWSRFGQRAGASEVRLAAGQGLPGWVAKHGRTLNVKDAYQDVRFDSSWDRIAGVRTTSTLCVPVKSHHGRTIGVLQVLNRRSGYFGLDDESNRRSGYFGLDDESMLAALAAQVAVSLENSKLFLSVVGKNMELLETKERLEQKVRELDVLFEVAQVAASAVRLDDLLEGVLARAMHAVDAEAGSILLSDDTTGQLRFRCAVGGDPEAVKRLTIAPDEGIGGWVARHGEAQIVNDVDKDARHSRSVANEVGYHPRSVLCVPLRLASGLGALELLNKAQGRLGFTDDDLKLSSVVAGHVSSAIDLAQARERRERQERLSTIGSLLSGIVHDLRGPMSVISGYARLLTRDKDPEQLDQYGGAILRQVETVNAMTGEILAFARGEKNLLVHRVYLREFFEELAAHLRTELEGKNIHFGLELKDRGTALFDRHKIRRAVHNLVRNAAQAIGTRGGEIVLAVERRPDGALALTCTDDGPGIPAEIRDQLFDEFTSHGKPDGTGLGLAIVRTVVADHGGTIDVNSEPGRTVFTIVLPQVQVHDSKAPPSAGEEQATA